MTQWSDWHLQICCLSRLKDVCIYGASTCRCMQGKSVAQCPLRIFIGPHLHCHKTISHTAAIQCFCYTIPLYDPKVGTSGNVCWSSGISVFSSPSLLSFQPLSSSMLNILREAALYTPYTTRAFISNAAQDRVAGPQEQIFRSMKSLTAGTA